MPYACLPLYAIKRNTQEKQNTKIKKFLTYGTIQGINYLTTYKIGTEVIRRLADNSKVVAIDEIVDYNGYVLIRDVKQRFYSGLAQACYHPNQRALNRIKEALPLVDTLNKYWYTIKKDMHLVPYMETAYTILQNNANAKALDIKNWHPEGLDQNMMHSNKDFYLEIERTLNSEKLKPRIKKEIEVVLSKESSYINKILR